MEEDSKIEEKVTRKSANRVLVGLFVLFIVLLGFFYLNYKFSLFNKDDYLFEGEYRVVKQSDNIYLLRGYIGDVPLNLRLFSNPIDVKDIESEDDIRKKVLFNRPKVYVTMSNELSADSIIAASEIIKIIGHKQLFGLPAIGAITEDISDMIPVKTCDDANINERIILLRLADKTRIYSDGFCVIIDGESEQDLIKAADKLVLQLLGIL